MKNIVINQNKTETLSFEDIYERYKPLVQKKAWSWVNTYELDELIQIGSIAMWKAYENYDAEKYPVAFGYFSGMYIDNALLRHHQRNKPKTGNKTSQIKHVVSMEDVIFTGKDGGDITLEDFLGEEETFSQNIADRLVLQKIFKKFTAKQRKDIEDYINGYTYSEIAQNNNLSRQAASVQMKNNFMKFRTAYIREMMS